MLEQGHVDHASLDGRHRLQLQDLAALHDPLRGAVGDVPELLLAASAVVLHVDGDPVMLALSTADDQVDDVLQARELLATAADQRAEVIALDVEAGGLAAARDLDRPGQAHQRQHLLEDGLCRLERRTLLVGQLAEGLAGHEGGRLAARSVGSRLARSPVGTWLTDVAVPAVAALASAATTATSAAGPTAGVAAVQVGTRLDPGLIGLGKGGDRLGGSGRIGLGSLCDAWLGRDGLLADCFGLSGRAPAWRALAGRLGALFRLGRPDRLGGLDGRLGGGQDARLLAADAEDASATLGEDLDVELAQVRAVLRHRGADRLFYVLAGEFTEGHRFRPRRLAPPCLRFAGRVPARLPPVLGALLVAGAGSSVGASSVSMRFGRELCATPASGDAAQRGCQPNSGKRLPHPMIRYCCTTR